jgi:hypothetical protein
VVTKGKYFESVWGKCEQIYGNRLETADVKNYGTGSFY